MDRSPAEEPETRIGVGRTGYSGFAGFEGYRHFGNCDLVVGAILNFWFRFLDFWITGTEAGLACEATGFLELDWRKATENWILGFWIVDFWIWTRRNSRCVDFVFRLLKTQRECDGRKSLALSVAKA